MSLQPTDLLIIQRGDKSYKMAASELSVFLPSAEVGDGTITIKQDGIADQSFTVNQDGDTEIVLKNDNTFTSAGDGLVASGNVISVGQGTGLLVDTNSVGIADGGVGNTQLADFSVSKDKINAAAPGANKYLQINSANSALQWTNVSVPEVPDPFPAGTKMLFQQSSAPTGWVKSTTANDRALRVVSGSVSSGGTDTFSTVFNASKRTDNHTLTTSQIPSHTHLTANANTGAGVDFPTGAGFLVNGNAGNTSSATGGGQAHSHPMTMDLQYVDVIIAVKS